MEKSKKLFTKRRVLILVNAVYFVLTSIACILSILMSIGWAGGDYTFGMARFVLVFGFVSGQCTFTGFTLVVYYLAIMAGALNKKYKEEVEESTENKK